eukprot:CAMPEP_0175762814 /NCGR_PEP_ID=MMETSP0097-20121207/67404_1 /TAXON_ID=311494 /ORGANISM="Alexandrium monilatum, Strain CCMP3105" /LENGTH=48 /DNA_ID= /DNA_START= /DNA_END= /DNA_ORIENTATION=
MRQVPRRCQPLLRQGNAVLVLVAAAITALYQIRLCWRAHMADRSRKTA